MFPCWSFYFGDTHIVPPYIVRFRWEGMFKAKDDRIGAQSDMLVTERHSMLS